MDAHAVRNARWAQSYAMDKDKVNLTLKGYSRAAFRTGFYIHELGIMLDAGPQNFNRPHHIFITHCHGDHVAELPFTFIETETNNNTTPTEMGSAGEEEREPTQLYGPIGSQKFITNYIESMFQMNIMHHISLSNGPYRWFDYREVSEKDAPLELNLKNNRVRVQVIKCDHSIPTVSYIFRIVKDKLKPEYLGLPGREIAEMRKSGVEITYPQERPLFAYVCDCSIKTVAQYETELTQCPYAIIECTFLWEDDLENADKTKHIHWQQLEPYVTRYPQVTWILIHFSLRYQDKDIEEFFQDKLEKYPNILPWIGDPGIPPGYQESPGIPPGYQESPGIPPGYQESPEFN